MSQQRKIPVEEMIRIVELYLSGKIGFTSAYQEAGVSDEAFRKWLFRQNRRSLRVSTEGTLQTIYKRDQALDCSGLSGMKRIEMGDL